MSSMSFILTGVFILILFDSGETITNCPTNYNNIAGGCYKLNNGSKLMWSEAWQDCLNETGRMNQSVADAVVHLLALENDLERNALFYWMKAWGVAGSFWTDGMVSASTWNWSNQSITWFFTSQERAVIGNGTYYKLAYSSNVSTYQMADDVDSTKLNYICEYQTPCNSSICLNDGTCYSNTGQELCVCAPGFTGDNCKINIDECLSSPCLHDGNCTDGNDNYTCDCSGVFYEGANCEIPTSDPTETQRAAAFWSVLGVVTGLVVILTLSDLPWEDMLTAVGCSCSCFNCCCKENKETDLYLSNSPTNDYNSAPKQMPAFYGASAPKGTNYHVMNTVWDSERINNQTSRTAQYNGYRSPDQSKTPDNTHIQSFALAKQKEKDLADNRIYAVNINDQTRPKSKDHVDTMVSWTQQLQEQLKSKKPRETSASSTNQLIHNDN